MLASTVLLAPLTTSGASASANESDNAVALERIHVGDPTDNLGIYRGEATEPLHFRLTEPAEDEQIVDYVIADYFATEVASGTVTIPAGDTVGSVPLPDLPPGNYRARAALDSAPDMPIVGYFAHLPDAEPVTGPANRFGVMTQSYETVEPEMFDAFAAAMAEMGAGYAREEILWPDIEPEPGDYDTDGYDAQAQTLRDHGIEVLAFWGSEEGRQAPDWAMTETSQPLPADLRDAYNFTNHLADQAIGADALELWNEPEQEAFCCTTGDQLAAYTKAAALGIADADGNPLTLLPAFFTEGAVQDLMLQGEVARYADIWSFHNYPEVLLTPDEPMAFPPQSDIQHDLRRLYGADIPAWATEAGVFAYDDSGDGLPVELQAAQARYLVQSTVADLATGTDKRFWFIAPPCCEPYYFGLLSDDLQPWPSYSAYAALTATLGTADHVRTVDELPSGATGHVFDNAGQEVTVVWADSDTDVDVPVSDYTVDVVNIMGERTATLPVEDGHVSVTASPDAIYLVGTEHGDAQADTESDEPGNELTTADRIVLNQRYTADNAAPEKHVDESPPYGYRLDESTEMAVEVYNFSDAEQEVTVTPQAFGGWIVDAEPRTVTVAAGDRVDAPFTIRAGVDVAPGVDYPLVFDATVDAEPVPPSVSTIQLTASQLPLAPSITDIAPAGGDTVSGPAVAVTAIVADTVSGVDADRIDVEVDGEPVHYDYDPGAGRLTAELDLDPGRHTVWIRAYNNAHAPAHSTVTFTVT